MQQQQQLNKAIEETKALMAQVKNAANPQAVLAQALQNNPNTSNIYSLLQNNGNLESIAKQMAQSKGIDINQLISQLSNI